MAQFDAEILLNTRVNQASLNKAAASIQKVAQAAKLIKPLNLFAPGAGAGADKIKVALAEIDKVVKQINNPAATRGVGKLSSTFAGASQQAGVILDVLSNVNLKAKNSAKQVEAYANAYVRANKEARKNERILNDILRKAKGLQPQAVRDAEVQKRIQLRDKLKKERDAKLNTGPRTDLGSVKEYQQRIAYEKELKKQQTERIQRVKSSRDVVKSNIREIERAREKAHQDGLRRVREFDKALERNAANIRKQTEGLAKRFGAGIGGGLIGAGFPALFGASSGEIAGGGIGGLLGGLVAGQSGSFTGAIIGSALGRIAETRELVNQLSKDLGFSAEQTELLGKAFETAGFKGQKGFQDALTALTSTGLTLDNQVDAIRAATALSERYGGDLAKIASSVGKVFNAGKVSVADLNRLQSQGIPIQQKIADNLGITRKEVIALARDGKLQVKALSDAFVDLGNEALNAPKKSKGEFSELLNLVNDLAKAVSALAVTLLRVLQPAIQGVAKQAIVAIKLITRLLGLGEAAQAQQALTGEGFRSFFTFGSTDKGIEGLAQALSRLSATGAESVEQLNDLEKVVQNYEGFAQRFDLSQGQLSEKILQPQITRLKKEIAERRKLLGLQDQKLIGQIDPPFQVDPGGGKGKERKSRVDKLQRELALQKQLFAIQGQIDAAELTKDKDTAVRLKGEQELARIAKERADIIASDVPVAEKLLELQKNSVEADRARAATEQQLKTLSQERARTINEAVIGFNNEVALLGERNQYAKELLKIEQDIAALRRDDPSITTEQIDAYRAAAQGAAAAREEQRLYNEVLKYAQPAVTNLVNGLRDVVAGTKSAEEAFADFLNTIANQLIQTASTMIAQYIAIGIARAFAGIPASGSGGFGGTSIGVADSSAFNLGGFGIPFAEGGFVTRPTGALVGEAGEPEYIVPASKMGEAMSRYNAGARGDAVIPGPGGGNGSMGGGGSSPTVVNYNGPTLSFNSDDYVPVSAVAGIIDQAAKQGAEQGQARTINTLKNSRSRRQKLGI